ncbi:hypothetical protein KJ925_05700, partial [Patescibacteria group bacterium]|nr:hypothetical protein [Patescibacteria group bacterium]
DNLGDCEDKVFVVSSILTNLGVHNSIVLGTHKGQKHAWVEAKANGDEYIIETTSNKIIPKEEYKKYGYYSSYGGVSDIDWSRLLVTVTVSAIISTIIAIGVRKIIK